MNSNTSKDLKKLCIHELKNEKEQLHDNLTKIYN